MVNRAWKKCPRVLVWVRGGGCNCYLGNAQIEVAPTWKVLPLCGSDSFRAVFFEVWWGSISWFLLATFQLPLSFSFGLFGTCNFYLLYANRFNFLPCLIDIMSIVWLMSQVCIQSVKLYLWLWKYFPPFLELHLISIELSPGVLAGHKFAPKCAAGLGF